MAPVLALGQFIAEHPVRPETTWEITGGTLRGEVYGPHAGGTAAVEWFAEVLGCKPVPKHTFEYAGQSLRVMALSTRWRDVPVLIWVSVAEQVVVPTQIRTSDGTVLVPAQTAVAA
jgi:hypothetical protein